MFQNITQSYDLSNATWEIIIMLLVAFILGYILRWILGGSNSICCDSNKAIPSGIAFTQDNEDLKVVEGIGPKIEELLKDAGISNWDDLANADADKVKQILADAGDRFKFHDPSTWADQADLARTGCWDELKELQDILDGGKVV